MVFFIQDNKGEYVQCDPENLGIEKYEEVSEKFDKLVHSVRVYFSSDYIEGAIIEKEGLEIILPVVIDGVKFYYPVFLKNI